MRKSELSRRDFQKLTAASVGGLIVGAGLRPAAAQEKKEKKNPLLEEPHVCRGLNTCKMLDKTKKNACAGQGACFTAEKHDCKGMGACRGQGGCGEHAGENECKQMGECAVPLKAATWTKARKRFEELMKKEGKTVGPAPKA